MLHGTLGNTIRKKRIFLGYSQEELAEKIGITPTHMKHLESEHRKPSLEVLIRLMETLDMSFDMLVFPQMEQFKNNEWASMLSGCTQQELNVIQDLIVSMKKNRTY